MGQVHPTGPNVLKVCQQGGHGCDCSEPRFNPDHALSDVRLSSLVPADDVRDKFRQASNRLRRGRKIVFFAVIFMVVGSQLATIPIRMLRPQTSRCNSCDFNENESGCTNCYLVCCPKSTEITPKNENVEACASNFTEKQKYANAMRFQKVFIEDGSKNACDCKHGDTDEESHDDHEHRRRQLFAFNLGIASQNRELRSKKSKKKDNNNGGRDACSGRAYLAGDVTREEDQMWLMAIFLPLVLASIFLPLFYICWRAKRSQQEIEGVFAPWGAQNIKTTYIRPTKHTPAWLCFQFLGQQQPMQTLNGNVIIVQQPGAQQQQQIYGVQQVQQGSIIQQPGMVQGRVLQPVQSTQPMQMQQGRVLQPVQSMQPMQIQQGQIIYPIQQQGIQPTVVSTTVSSSSNTVAKI